MQSWTGQIGSGAELRFGLFPSFMYVKARVTGELAGIAVELAHALASDLGMSARLIEFPAPPQVVAALRDGECEVAFLGIDPVRGADVDYSPPLMRADFTYLVPAGCDVATIAGADRPGTRIAVVRGHAMETALVGKISSAHLVHAATPDAAFALLTDGAADVLAGIRPGLLAYAERLVGARVLAECYGSNTLALAVRKGDASGLARIRAFVVQAKASGLAVRSIVNAGLRGVDVVQDEAI